ncbi:MAG: DUF3467 domain-containing protein [Micrococcales bacterium]|nr:DUF3467 domain-containing protein [Micrococcales bacterium]
MSAGAGSPLHQQFQMNLPPDKVAGVFADFASIWHTPNVFVMDFVALAQPPETSVDPETGQPRVLIPSQVVSRIRIPPEQVFEMAKALTQQLEMWEQETGRRPPTKPLFGPTTGEPAIDGDEGEKQ